MAYSTNSLRQLRFTIGQNIHILRLRKKMTLQKLSKISGISENLLDQYELGKNEISLYELLKISYALKSEIKKIIE